MNIIQPINAKGVKSHPRGYTEPAEHPSAVTVLNLHLVQWQILWDTVKDALLDKAEGFTCTEADAIAGHARWLGDVRWANAFAEAHAAGDEEGDAHHGDTVEGSDTRALGGQLKYPLH